MISKNYMIYHDMHPGKLTCPLIINGWKMYFLLNYRGQSLVLGGVHGFFLSLKIVRVIYLEACLR